MKQLGNLALTCAKRPDTRLIIGSDLVVLYVAPMVGDLPKFMTPSMYAHWDDEEKIKQMIRELNFGKYRQKGD